MNKESLFTSAKRALACCDVDEKVELTNALSNHWENNQLSLSPCDETIVLGRPSKPELVSPRQLQKRGMGTLLGQVAMIHAIAHIEFNAINLALDAICRFQKMPVDYYHDWVKVACEEAYHFSLIAAHLTTLGHQYGDFPAHNGLWGMVEETAYDVLARMALVPRVLEARGLDVTPGILEKFKTFNDHHMMDILSIILRDEIGHVAVGNRWFHYLCQIRQLEPMPTFIHLVDKHFTGEIKGPFSIANREQAGFTPDEIAWLCTH